MRGMGRLWQAAGTVNAVLRPGLLEKAAGRGLRSLFVGFETLDRRQPARAGEAPEPRPRLRRGGPPAARPRRDGQRQLRVRDGRATTSRVFDAHGRVGGRAGHRDRDLPHPDALSGHGAARAACAAAGPDASRATGTSTTRATPSSARRGSRRSSWRAATGGPTATSTAGARSCAAPQQAHAARCAAACRVRRGLEEVRAALGPADPAKRAGHALPLLERVLDEGTRDRWRGRHASDTIGPDAKSVAAGVVALGGSGRAG